VSERLEAVKHRLARLGNLHLPREGKDVFLFSTPRGGSTWLSELILTQPGFKPADEPFNLRDAPIRAELSARGIEAWTDLHDPAKEEAMFSYIESIRSGANGVVNPFFHRNHFRLVTRRICFKILHAGEERVSAFRRRFGGFIVLLLRHPIPVSLSRKELPRLRAFLSSGYRSRLTAEQIACAERILSSGSDLDRAVLDWCLQTSVPVSRIEPDWTIVTYEQLVTDPHPVLEHLAKRLELPHPERMARSLTRASGSTYQSDPATRDRLSAAGGAADRSWLVDKWRAKVDADAVSRAMAALSVFGLGELYRPDSPLPDRFWIRLSP
jgi:LPS sulfotransferase NodH